MFVYESEIMEPPTQPEAEIPFLQDLEPSERLRYLSVLAHAAMRGENIPFLHHILVGYNENCLALHYYLDRPCTEEERDDLTSVGTEIISHLPFPWTIEEEFVVANMPQTLPPKPSLGI